MENIHSSLDRFLFRYQYIRFRGGFFKGILRIYFKSQFLLHGDRYLYENNYLPITGYDETAGIQFVDRLMIKILFTKAELTV